MRLYFYGHEERYAIEQTLLVLFPDERPEYPAEDCGDDNALVLRLLEEADRFCACATLRRNGKTYEASASSPRKADDTDELSHTRLRRRALARAFYFAATESLGTEPPWGMLFGVRPVKLPVRAVLAGATLQEAEAELQGFYHVSPSRAALAMDCAKAAFRVQEDLSPNEIALYVGIPFCPTRCAYCSFVSAAGNTNRLIPPYLEALHGELRAAGAAVREAGRSVRSVYLGGGTPTTLTAESLTSLLAAISQEFPLAAGAEITVEAGRPDTITREKLEAIRNGGATRISLNPQTLSDAVLSAIGRAHSTEDFYSAWNLVQAFDFPAVNMDLIAGLPGDSVSGFSKGLEGVLALSPENITVHTLAKKRGSRLREEGGSIPDEASLSAMLDYAWARLRESGYVPYYLYRQKYMSGGFENIGWCKPGHESDYNICMMEELCSVLSLGAGGVTKLVDYTRGSLTRLANPKYPQEYIRDSARILTEKRQPFSLT